MAKLWYVGGGGGDTRVVYGRGECIICPGGAADDE